MKITAEIRFKYFLLFRELNNIWGTWSFIVLS